MKISSREMCVVGIVHEVKTEFEYSSVRTSKYDRGWCQGGAAENMRRKTVRVIN